MRIAAVQLCAGTDLGANLAAAGEGIARAAAAGAALVVLPENFACYGGDYRAFAAEQSPVVMEWLAAQAQRHRIVVHGGTLPLATRPDGSLMADGRVRTSSLVWGSDGELLARYDKIHLFDAEVPDAQGRYAESDQFEPGDQLVCLQVGGWTLGLAVCYDLRFPALAQALVGQGAELLLYPSAFTQVTGEAHWSLLLRARAVETGCYVLGANQCGQHNPKRASYGHSQLIDPWGQIVAECDGQPGLLRAELDKSWLSTVRQRLPVQSHQRLQPVWQQHVRDS
ncbi:carbon-nitrogen hydrolase family protein [Isoalcanivorax beigongshangi]|uniref:Carbon-nitrogen hydrolase family protein n=1 Tax=Isoalcanivorax beigongshangi TaxID=3238810 RepID=A0ABV4AJF2_9GAMM